MLCKKSPPALNFFYNFRKFNKPLDDETLSRSPVVFGVVLF